MLEENCGPRLFDRLLLAIKTYWHWSAETEAEREWYSELHLFCCQPGVVFTSHKMAEKRLSKTCNCLNCFLSRSQLPLLPCQWEDQQSLMLMGYSFTASIALVHLAQSYFTEFQGLYKNEASLSCATASSSSSVAFVYVSSAETFHCEQQSVCLPAGCVPCPRAWPGALAGPQPNTVATWTGNPNRLARSGWCVGVVESVVEPRDVTQRFCLARAFGKESMVKPFETFIYSTNCCCNLQFCHKFTSPQC